MTTVTFKIDGEAEKKLKSEADLHQRDVNGQAKTIVLISFELYAEGGAPTAKPEPSRDERAIVNGHARVDD